MQHTGYIVDISTSVKLQSHRDPGDFFFFLEMLTQENKSGMQNSNGKICLILFRLLMGLHTLKKKHKQSGIEI